MSPLIVVLPVVVPLVTAALLLLFGERYKRTASLVSVLSTIVGLAVAVTILLRVDDGGSGAMAVSLASIWEGPFGIVLVADRL